jgi:hypothetical protein
MSPAVLVSRELDRGFALVDVAATRTSPLFAQAEKALSTVTALLPRISGVGEDERLRIKGKAKELRFRLDLVPVCVRPIEKTAHHEPIRLICFAHGVT